MTNYSIEFVSESSVATNAPHKSPEKFELSKEQVNFAEMLGELLAEQFRVEAANENPN